MAAVAEFSARPVLGRAATLFEKTTKVSSGKRPMAGGDGRGKAGSQGGGRQTLRLRNKNGS
jgi:hypothetical protein